MEKSVRILNEEGMHARPAASFVQEASKYTSEITISVGDKSANAKSIMSLMALGITKDTEIKISASGDDGATAVESLVGLVNNKFNL